MQLPATTASVMTTRASSNNQHASAGGIPGLVGAHLEDSIRCWISCVGGEYGGTRTIFLFVLKEICLY